MKTATEIVIENRNSEYYDSVEELLNQKYIQKTNSGFQIDLKSLLQQLPDRQLKEVGYLALQLQDERERSKSKDY